MAARTGSAETGPPADEDEMKDRKLATRYARALYDSLPDPSAAELADEFLAALADAISRSADLRNALRNPAVSRASRKKLLVHLAEQHAMPSQVKSFLAILADNGRGGNLVSIATLFHEIREAEAGIVPVQMMTARPLPSDLLDRTRQTLEKVTGKKVRLEVEVSPSLIGGAMARVGSQVYDGSLRTQLDILRQRMAAE